MLTEKKSNYKIKKIFALFTLHMLNFSISIIRIFYFKIYKRKSNNLLSKKEKNI